jgi:hypothetical protein
MRFELVSREGVLLGVVEPTVQPVVLAQALQHTDAVLGNAVTEPPAAPDMPKAKPAKARRSK